MRGEAILDRRSKEQGQHKSSRALSRTSAFPSQALRQK